MGERPRLAILVYGSLLDPAELDTFLSDCAGRVWPVRLQGFERICNQVASWRPTEADQQAVLNVVRNEGSWCNALAVTDLRRTEFQAFTERERGYRLLEVDTDCIDPYAPGEVDTDGETQPPLDEQDLLLVTTGTNVAHDIAPIPGYLGECLDGASHWGERFRADFEATTAANPGTHLPAEFTE